MPQLCKTLIVLLALAMSPQLAAQPAPSYNPAAAATYDADRTFGLALAYFAVVDDEEIVNHIEMLRSEPANDIYAAHARENLAALRRKADRLDGEASALAATSAPSSTLHKLFEHLGVLARGKADLWKAELDALARNDIEAFERFHRLEEGLDIGYQGAFLLLVATRVETLKPGDPFRALGEAELLGIRIRIVMLSLQRDSPRGGDEERRRLAAVLTDHLARLDQTLLAAHGPIRGACDFDRAPPRAKSILLMLCSDLEEALKVERDMAAEMRGLASVAAALVERRYGTAEDEALTALDNKLQAMITRRDELQEQMSHRGRELADVLR